MNKRLGSIRIELGRNHWARTAILICWQWLWARVLAASTAAPARLLQLLTPAPSPAPTATSVSPSNTLVGGAAKTAHTGLSHQPCIGFSLEESTYASPTLLAFN
jgi:hypothetical protein